MANEYGDAWRVHVKKDAAFVAIGGETSFDWKRSSQEQDISDKDSGIYGASSYNNQKINFSISGNLKLPDAGFTAVNAASKGAPPEIELKIMRGDVVKYHGVVAIGNLSGSFPKTGPATYSIDAANAAAPLVDDLTAED